MAASIESVAYELGAVLGVAIMGSVLSFAYAATLVLPKDFPTRCSPKTASIKHYCSLSIYLETRRPN
jgi:hypothetical protein